MRIVVYRQLSAAFPCHLLRIEFEADGESDTFTCHLDDLLPVIASFAKRGDDVFTAAFGPVRVAPPGDISRVESSTQAARSS